MLGHYKSRRPPKNFNLIFLQTNQPFSTINQLRVQIYLKKFIRVQGNLHLCTRSIFFQPKNSLKPILRIKYSCGVFLRMMKNIQSKKIDKMLILKKNQKQIKEILSKAPNQIAEILQQKPQRNDSPSRQVNKPQFLLTKLYENEKKKVQNQQKQKILSCFFIKVPKMFIINRKPISPFITQKTNDNFIFSIHKTNHKMKVLRFLKIYDQITKCSDQQKLIKNIVSATQQENKQYLIQKHKQDKLQATNIFKCKRINIEGAQFGQFILFKNRVSFIPLINCPTIQSINFTFRQIKFIHKYRYLYEDLGIQVWLYNYPHSILLVFDQKNIRQSIYRHLRISGQKIIKLQINQITNMWVDGQLSNVQYLNYINMFSNRSFNDLSQYPVFPWIFHNWDVDFNLRNHQNFRNLQRPIGAINKHRLRKLKDIYQINVRDKTVTNPPHLYSTHYSTPGYVCYYLLRKIPQFIVKLQNGVFSPSDRIFRSIQSGYYSCMNSVADFKQLTPQFFGEDSSFLVNCQKLQMGSTPQGQVIDDVLLPKWAKNSEEFLLKMRAAFQSDYVSAHLNQWIDLIFGFKQAGTNAITSDNLFYFLTYKENVDLNKNMSKIQKAALKVQISQFGQCPIQIFEGSHPIKKTRIINLDVNQVISDQKVVTAKMLALGQQNQRLQQQLQRERYRFTRKLNQKQEILMKTHKDKKKDLDKVKQMLSIDTNSLKNFQFKKNFNDDDQKDTYIRQLQELIKERDSQNEEMKVIIAGMKRQVQDDDNESFDSQLNQDAQIDPNFLQEEK